MRVIEIVEKYLKDNGYDGLCQPGVCGCRLDDGIMPCEECVETCKPGYLQESDDPDCDWVIGLVRKKAAKWEVTKEDREALTKTREACLAAEKLINEYCTKVILEKDETLAFLRELRKEIVKPILAEKEKDNG